MNKKQYTQPTASVIRLVPQSMLAASEGQKMLKYSEDNGSVNFNNSEEITTEEDIW